MRTRLSRIVAAAAAVLLLSEGWARRALPRVPGGVDSERNPYRFRGWPEYIRDVRAAPREATIVLISNSQAYAGEYPPRYTYPARLEALLRTREVMGRSDWNVLNWSSDGMTSIEYVLLARYLQRHPPGLVLAMTGFADYSLEHAHRGFLHCRTDLPRLATRVPIFRGLPLSYIRRHARLEDTLAFWVRDRVALYRYKEYLWSWLDVRMPGIHTFFYAPFVNYRPWELKGPRWLPAVELPRGRGPGIQFAYGEESRLLLREYLDMLARVPARVIVAAQPRRTLTADARAQWDEQFFADLKVGAAERGLEFWDLRDVLPDQDFLTSSHLKPPNHRRLAELLCDRLEAALREPR